MGVFDAVCFMCVDVWCVAWWMRGLLCVWCGVVWCGVVRVPGVVWVYGVVEVGEVWWGCEGVLAWAGNRWVC